jgi:lipopolysaccharide/colanic/teichoic acid biosynthesis glycosyltransferase
LTRILDILLSLVAIIVLLPFMIPIMIGLKLTGERYIFYSQPRVGRGDKDFKVLKFATMLKDSPNMPGGFITQRDDPRITPMGGFLRRTKINELPQLANILVGQMSFVGPRPVVRKHLELYSDEAREAISRQRPGLTGIASLAFRDEEGVLDRAGGDRKRVHDEVIAPYKGELEIWYAERKGIGLFFLIIAMTAWSVARPASRLPFSVLKDLPAPPKELARLLGL